MTARPPDDPLALDAEQMRAMGHLVIDRLVERITALPDEPVLRTASREELAARLDGPPPAAGTPFAALLDRLERDVLSYVGHFDHPRFFGYIPGAGTWPAALGDLIASAVNIDAGSWREAAGPSQLELTVLRWFAGWIGYPPDAGGILVSGGSAANLAAVACAREVLAGPMNERLVIYVSDQSHSSIARAARQLGFRHDQVRVIPTDEHRRLRPADLAAAIDHDAADGKEPLLVAAVGGSTNTGAVDPLPAVAEVAHDRGVWVHVDAAYGGFAVLTERGREALAGLEAADSVTLDPHKWLAMPFEVGCLMTREANHLERAFAMVPEYLRDRASATSEVNFADRGMQLTRASRAIKVWLSLATFGVDAYRSALDRALDLAALAQRRIEGDPRLELVSPASLGIVVFRRRFEGDASQVDAANAAVVASLAQRGEVLLTSTLLDGRYAIRLCVLNHSSTEADVRAAIAAAATSDVPARARVASPGANVRDVRLDRRWLRSHTLDSQALTAMPPFAGTPAGDAATFLAAGREQRVATGAAIVEQWAFSRDFHVIVEGGVSVRLGGRELALLGPGDVLGEIASLDWGRDFSYGRTASAIATEPTRVVTFPQAALRELMRSVPSVDAAIRRLAAARLANR